MNFFRNATRLLAVIHFLALGHAAEPERTLVWDSEMKEYETKPGELETLFSFTATNGSADEIVINEVKPSCGCTVVSLPAKPWKLAPGASGKIEAKVDLRGKRGILIKNLEVNSSVGVKNLIFKVAITNPVDANPGVSDQETLLRRARNQQAAGADRQAVFRNDCANCHVQPSVGKRGRDLFETSCGICHTAVHRASMVPELTGLPNGGNREYWHSWISHGKEASLMPAFSKSAGGPLTDEQINSLVDYALTELRMPKVVPVRSLPPVIGREISTARTESRLLEVMPARSLPPVIGREVSTTRNEPGLPEVAPVRYLPPVVGREIPTTELPIPIKAPVGSKTPQAPGR